MSIAGADDQRICDSSPVALGNAARDDARLIG
jgi:hypothetical protein